MSTEVMTPSRSTQLSQKRDLKANDIILKTYSIKKHLTLQPHKGKIMQNVYFEMCWSWSPKRELNDQNERLQRVRRTKLNRPPNL